MIVRFSQIWSKNHRRKILQSSLILSLIRETMRRPQTLSPMRPVKVTKTSSCARMRGTWSPLVALASHRDMPLRLFRRKMGRAAVKIWITTGICSLCKLFLKWAFEAAFLKALTMWWQSMARSWPRKQSSESLWASSALTLTAPLLTRTYALTATTQIWWERHSKKCGVKRYPTCSLPHDPSGSSNTGIRERHAKRRCSNAISRPARRRLLSYTTFWIT